MRSWSKRWRPWLGSIEFAYAAQQVVWREYLGTLDEVDARLGRYNEALHEQAQTSSQACLIAGLQILKGIAEVNAVTIVAELCDLMRFAHPAQLFGYVGMVPVECSSGGERRSRGVHAGRSVVACPGSAQPPRPRPAVLAVRASSPRDRSAHGRSR